MLKLNGLFLSAILLTSFTVSAKADTISGDCVTSEEVDAYVLECKTLKTTSNQTNTFRVSKESFDNRLAAQSFCFKDSRANYLIDAGTLSLISYFGRLNFQTKGVRDIFQKTVVQFTDQESAFVTWKPSAWVFDFTDLSQVITTYGGGGSFSTASWSLSHLVKLGKLKQMVQLPAICASTANPINIIGKD